MIKTIDVGDTAIYWGTANGLPVKRAAMITAVRTNDRYDLVIFNPNGMSHVNRVSPTYTEERGYFTPKD